MTPLFAIQGGALLVGARAACVACQLSVFGALVFRVAVMPRVFPMLQDAEARRVARRLLILAQGSVLLGLLSMGAWLTVEAGVIADAASTRALAAAFPVVAAHTRFGHLIVLQLVGFAVVGLVLGRRDRAVRQRAGLVVASAVLALQAMHGHAAALPKGPGLLLGVDLLHLAGAGGWLGGLLPLLLVVQEAPAKAAATAARWFSPVGKVCVWLIVLSAVGQSWVLVGSWAGLFGTGYGLVVLLKLALFVILLGFAMANRYRLAPALLRQTPGRARQALVRSIAVQSCFGLAVVVAAAVLSDLPPSMHMHAGM